jgi:NitT/TauT family transport system ATP-binding protein
MTPSTVAGSAAVAASGRDLIRLDRVAKTYVTADGPVESLKPLSFEIREGEFMSIVGPSGCGKSTLLKLVAGLLPASAGEIVLDGERVDGPPDDVGIVFQRPVLLAWRSVIDSVTLQIEPRLPARVRRQGQSAAGHGGTGARGVPMAALGRSTAARSLPRAGARPAVLLMDEPLGPDAVTRGG